MAADDRLLAAFPWKRCQILGLGGGGGGGVEDRSGVEWNSAHLLAMTKC